MRPGVTVITITRNRPALLSEAARSVNRQSGVLVEHLVVGDECPELERCGPTLAERVRSLRWVNVPRSQHEGTVSSRLAGLRNLGLSLVDTGYLAYLDDDNLYEPDHLASLLRTMEKGRYDAAHSHRFLLEHDGRPFLANRFPWTRDAETGPADLSQMISFGVLSPGSPVMRDRVSLPGGRSGTVDTSEWLIPTELHRRYPFPTLVTRDDEMARIGEDGVWLRLLVSAGIRIGCSGRPTLVYRLGGRSNPQAR